MIAIHTRNRTARVLSAAGVSRGCARTPPAQKRPILVWLGKGTVETARKKWSEALVDLFEAAKVPGGHAHRFRDTFAVELLRAGTPIERVSILLGQRENHGKAL
jgi:site-specific recombinase XerD